MKSFESERFEAIIFSQTIQKKTSFRKGKELTAKVAKSNKGSRESSQKFISHSPIFSMSILSSTEFSILRISCGSDNVKVTRIKTNPSGFLGVCYTYITRSRVTFCQRGLLVPVYLCVKVNVKKLLKLLFLTFYTQAASHTYKYIHRHT